MMRRSDDVFFFTLIDFLLQVFFFGLLLFAGAQAILEEQRASEALESKRREELFKRTGVSNLTELTDLLTKMAPLDDLRGLSDFMAQNGGVQGVREVVQAASAVGGNQKLVELAKKVQEQDKRIAQLEGWGKASCIPNVLVNGKLQPKSIATAVVTDERVILENPQPEMHALLSRHGMQFSEISDLSLTEFRVKFAPVVAHQPECRYFLGVVTKTRYLEPMRAVWSVFRTQ